MGSTLPRLPPGPQPLRIMRSPTFPPVRPPIRAEFLSGKAGVFCVSWPTSPSGFWPTQPSPTVPVRNAHPHRASGLPMPPGNEHTETLSSAQSFFGPSRRSRRPWSPRGLLHRALTARRRIEAAFPAAVQTEKLPRMIPGELWEASGAPTRASVLLGEAVAFRGKQGKRERRDVRGCQAKRRNRRP